MVRAIRSIPSHRFTTLPVRVENPAGRHAKWRASYMFTLGLAVRWTWRLINPQVPNATADRQRLTRHEPRTYIDRTGRAMLHACICVAAKLQRLTDNTPLHAFFFPAILLNLYGMLIETTNSEISMPILEESLICGLGLHTAHCYLEEHY
jgi:hypothetical protein